MKYANYLMAALFFFGAAVQYNDPDPVRWVAIYIAGAVACLLANNVRGLYWFPVSILVVCLVCVCLFVNRSMSVCLFKIVINIHYILYSLIHTLELFKNAYRLHLYDKNTMQSISVLTCLFSHAYKLLLHSAYRCRY